MNLLKPAVLVLAASLFSSAAPTEIRPSEAVFYFDFGQSTKDQSPAARELRLYGAQWREQTRDPLERKHGLALEFTNTLQYAAVDIAKSLDGIKSMTVGGWFYARRSGEQMFVARGVPEIAPLGEREFSPNERWVNFILGTDHRGFLLGTINGNGGIRFPYVTVNEVPIHTWNQLVVVKCADGYQKFYQNGTLVHSDRDSMYAGKVWPFRDIEQGEPVRFSVPMGGLIGEAWLFPRELSAQEIKTDYLSKRDRYDAVPPGKPVLLREENLHPAVDLWKEPLTAQSWPGIRGRLFQAAMKRARYFPSTKTPLDPKVLSETDCGRYVRRKISIEVQPGDRMPAYVLIPKSIKGRVPAILCMYGTTAGAGKDSTVGVSGYKRGSPPNPNWSFAIDMAEAGFVAFAADYLRDGERVAPGARPYDTADFYKRYPDWSITAKDAWDNMRAVDYLQTLEYVDSEKIGAVGHSYGAGNAISAAVYDPRVKVVVSNGPSTHFTYLGQAGRRPTTMTYYEYESLVAPRPLLVGQAVGERRPEEEENYAAVVQVYEALGCRDRVRFRWYAGDHDFPPVARTAAVEWFRRWFAAR